MSDQVTAGQVVAAIETGVVVAPTLHEVQTVNQLAARPIKLYDPATGEVKPQRADTADLLRGLMAREKIRTDERQVVDRQKAEAAWAAVRERRAKGLPDLCGECGAALGMSKSSIRLRSLSQWPAFNCKRCAMRKAQATLTFEQRQELGRKATASLTPKQRSDNARKARRGLTASLTPKQRSDNAQKAGRKAMAALAPHERQELSRKAHAARWAKKHQEST